MKLSSLYTNNDRLFDPILFNSGLNVVMAEIRVPQNKKKDTHNLGKTTLGRLLDFCFLCSKDSNFFLFKYPDIFDELVFFLEVELYGGGYLTVRRSVNDATKISFKRHDQPNQNLSGLPEGSWDHLDIPFAKAKELLDSSLNFTDIKPWNFRKALAYLLRTQDDYRDIFHLKKFASAHSDWKPYLAQILGFNAKQIIAHYKKESEYEEKKATEATIKAELGGSIEDKSKIEGLLLIKQTEANKKEEFLDSFDFRKEDKAKTKDLVEDLDEEIAMLNGNRYSLVQNKKRISLTLEEDKILFDPDEAKQLFEDAGVLFSGQIKRDFEQLIQFNKAITEERTKYLLEELKELDTQISEANSKLSSLGKRRSESLAYLRDTDIFSKHKAATQEVINLKAEIASLEKQKSFLHKLQDLRKEIRDIADDKKILQARIEEDVETKNSDSNSLFSHIRLYFNEIIEEVIDRKALLNVSTNSNGHLEFKAEILDKDGNTTSADLGRTYRKLLCIAFDMAIMRAHQDRKFPKFIFHDGIFESLDDRKKEKLVDIIRKYNDYGIQHIITLISSELPSSNQNLFIEDDIILLLHDEGDEGRLFKTTAW